MFGIINYTKKPITAESLFGKEVPKVDFLCNNIMWNKIDGFHGKHPAWEFLHENGMNAFDVKRIYGISPIEWRRQFEVEHPAKMEAYEEEKAAWVAENQKLFRQLYGIARRHHIRIEWNGNCKSGCMPDRFDIYKGGKRIAMIQV